MFRISTRFLVAAFILYVARSQPEKATAQEPLDAAGFQEFMVGKNGRPLLIPVELNGRPLLFLLDTGSAKTIFDTALTRELGPPHSSFVGETSGGDVDLPCFGCPSAKVGSLDLSVIGEVASADLGPLRRGIGKDIQGILGFDFLSRFAVELDFDNGTVRIHSSAPLNWQNGEAIELKLQGNVPAVSATLAAHAETMIIDTGANTSFIRTELFDQLTDTGVLRVCGASRTLTLGGGIKSSQGYAGPLKIGSSAHDTVRLSRDSLSGLGLLNLSRFQIRLDFPNMLAYFRPGGRYAETESIGTSGMAVLLIDGRKTVVAVEPESAAATAGLRSGDVVTSIDGVSAAEFDMHELGQILTSEVGRKIQIEVNRDYSEQAVQLKLRSRFD